MKKITVLVAAILISASGFSQSIDLGIKAGVNFANISGAPSGVTTKSITGFQAGVFAGLKLGEKIGIQGDLLYSQQGTEFSGTKFDLTYVNVPIVLKYYVFKGLNLQGGPQFGFAVSDNIKELSGGGLETKTMDISGIVGLGYDLPLGLRVDARYNFGLSDVLKDTGTVQGVATEGKNTVISLAVGFAFL